MMSTLSLLVDLVLSHAETTGGVDVTSVWVGEPYDVGDHPSVIETSDKSA